MKKLLSISMACLMLLLSACNSANPAGTGTGANGQPELNSDISFPINDREVELSYWKPLTNKITSFATSYSEVLAYQELERISGIKLNFQHPPLGQETEQFNLLMASKTLPDLIYYSWGSMPGGMDKLLDDGTIVKLDPYLESMAPNYNKVLKENLQAQIETQTDKGDTYMFALLKLDEQVRFYKGLLLREDWLKKLGLSVPSTLDDWYTMLKAFKEKDPNGNGANDEIPLVSKKMEALETFINAFGVCSDLMIKDGKVAYGPAQPEFKDALIYLNKLYSEGLIDFDFYLTDDNSMDAKVISNQSGAMYGALLNHISKYMTVMGKDNPDFSIVAAPSIQNADGNRYIFNRLLAMCTTFQGTAITKDNKHLAESLKLMDYLYSEEGHILANFGKEGESFEMVGGKPVYSDKIVNNSEGIPIGDMLARHALSSTNGSFVQSMDYLRQVMVFPQQQSAPGTWSSQIDKSRILPPITLTSDEQSQFSVYASDMSTYKDEMLNKFIIGTESLDGFDTFVSTLKSMGLEDALKIQQAAYDRYLTRGGER